MISQNRISELPLSIVCLTELTTLQIENNLINNIDPSIFDLQYLTDFSYEGTFIFFYFLLFF